MVERESKAHCLSNLADEKWQVVFFQSFLLSFVAGVYLANN